MVFMGRPLFVGITTNHDFSTINFDQNVPLLDISKRNHLVILVKLFFTS
jgi:hypothetical protein